MLLGLEFVTLIHVSLQLLPVLNSVLNLMHQEEIRERRALSTWHQVDTVPCLLVAPISVIQHHLLPVTFMHPYVYQHSSLFIFSPYRPKLIFVYFCCFCCLSFSLFNYDFLFFLFLMKVFKLTNFSFSSILAFYLSFTFYLIVHCSSCNIF